MTFPELFASALSVPHNPGSHRCFWCGASCDEQFPVRVSGTFWDWDAVAYPRSQFQCAGCCECLDEKRSMEGYDKPQKTRNHSWLATDAPSVRSFTKSHLPELRNVCLKPPAETWGLAIAESGQKHILYRTPVNYSGATDVAVQLELTAVRYSPADLQECVLTCAQLASVIGRPALSGPIRADCAYKIMRAGLEPELIERWNAVWNNPAWRLAACLCPGRKDCDAYLAEVDPSRVPQTVGGPARRARERSLFD